MAIKGSSKGEGVCVWIGDGIDKYHFKSFAGVVDRSMKIAWCCVADG